jgi:hypothetical protein
MHPAATTDGPVTATMILPLDSYLHRLRTLAAWWSLGSSALEPHLLMRYAPVTRSGLREAGL